MTTRQFQRPVVTLLLTISSKNVLAGNRLMASRSLAPKSRNTTCVTAVTRNRDNVAAHAATFSLSSLSGSHKKFHFSYMKFLCLLKFLFIKVLKENSFHFNGFSMVLQWAQRQQFLKFKFKFKFIYSHLFNYNTTTIRKKKRNKKTELTIHRIKHNKGKECLAAKGAKLSSWLLPHNGYKWVEVIQYYYYYYYY